MRRFAFRYRNLPRFLLRRVTGEVDTLLIVVTIGLAMLDLLYVAQRIVDSLPATAGPGLHGP